MKPKNKTKIHIIMKKEIIILAASILATSAVAQTEVITGVTRGKDYGVTYILPKSEIEITIQATKHVYTPGQFSKYADRYMRLSDVSSDPKTYWTLDNLQAKMTGMADRDKVYFVKLKDKTVAPLIELTKDGIVCSINMPLGSGQPTSKPETQPLKKQNKEIDPRDFLTEEILMSNSTAKMAELVAKDIYNIRESRNALLRGEAENLPKDGEQLKIMLDNLNIQEQAMTEMFSGKTTEESKAFTFRVVPKEMKNDVLFRFSKKLGVVANNDLAGDPVYVTLTDLKAINIPMEDNKKKPVDGIAYNVPGKGSITIQYLNQNLYNGEIPVTQFGTVEYLAPVLFNKKSTVKVLFNPETGSLVKVDRGE